MNFNHVLAVLFIFYTPIMADLLQHTFYKQIFAVLVLGRFFFVKFAGGTVQRPIMYIGLVQRPIMYNGRLCTTADCVQRPVVQRPLYNGRWTTAPNVQRP